VGEWSAAGQTTQGFRWTTATGLQLLAAGGLSGISGDGSIAVGVETINDGANSQAYRWDIVNGAVLLGKLPTDFPSPNSYGKDISTDGEVIVGDQVDTSRRAFRWTQATGMTELGPVPNGYIGVRTSATSADGSVVVGDLELPGPGAPIRFDAGRWTQATGWVSIGGLPGAENSDAWSVSGDGSVVVGVSSIPQAEPFIWDAARGMRNLADVLRDDYGLAASLVGWNLNTAWDISEDGRTIVGNGLAPDGVVRPFVAFLGTPVPEPTTLALVGAGACLAFVCTRRLRRSGKVLQGRVC
jgi:probable HAF family extracellular repeat protein